MMDSSSPASQLFVQRYQPRRLDDFELDTEMRTLLRILLETDSLNLLLVGESGSGKTALLSALLHEYYGKSPSDPDIRDNILFINNLKEQGIHYYRNDVKIFCQTCSTVRHRKKVVVLDDVDFINEQSQQVFRNYMDNFSSNVHFIASTNNIQKVIESLQSRFLLLHCQSLTHENLRTILHNICTKEGIDVRPDAEDLLLSLCQRSAKTLLNYLEKVKLLGPLPIDRVVVDKVCTNISFSLLESITQQFKEGDLRGSIRSLYALYDKGYSVMDILDTYFLFLKTASSASSASASMASVTTCLTEDEIYHIVPYLCQYITVFHNVHEDETELALLANNIVNLFARLRDHHHQHTPCSMPPVPGYHVPLLPNNSIGIV
jgi:DNA polymerase III delta prime subunit